MITLGEILDLLDPSRESCELVEIMNDNGEVQCRATVCSVIWNGIEDRIVENIAVNNDCLRVWLTK